MKPIHYNGNDSFYNKFYEFEFDISLQGLVDCDDGRRSNPPEFCEPPFIGRPEWEDWDWTYYTIEFFALSKLIGRERAVAFTSWLYHHCKPFNAWAQHKIDCWIEDRVQDNSYEDFEIGYD